MIFWGVCIAANAIALYGLVCGGVAMSRSRARHKRQLAFLDRQGELLAQGRFDDAVANGDKFISEHGVF